MSTHIPDAMNMENRVTNDAITTGKAEKWADAFIKYGVPIIILIVGGVIGWQTFRNDLIDIRENSARDAARIETLRNDYQKHQDAITKLEANALAMNSRLDVMAATIDRRFDALDKRMDSLTTTMQALLMAYNERGNK
jgi:predicted negative regulator of RcsB-dependent stress response